MKKINIILLVLTISVSSCKQEPKFDYKYADKDNLFPCSEADIDLIKEATYAFEDYVIKNYDFRGSSNKAAAYYNFTRNASHGLTPMVERLDDHLITITETLRNKKYLWSTSNPVSLNYQNNLTSCIVNNIEDDEIRNTFNVLTSSNTMGIKTITPLIQAKLDIAIQDKAIAAYIALDMFYAKLINFDYSLPKEELYEIVREQNKNTLREQNGDHSGHNH